jgi:hypothetical protein
MQVTIEVKKTSKKGLGVFALKDFKDGEVVETCPALIFNTKDRKRLEKTQLAHYIYPWRSTRGAALVLGYGSVYNHSFAPNADWKQNFKTQSMVFRAIKDINKGDEITVNYNSEPDDNTPIDWFEVK